MQGLDLFNLLDILFHLSYQLKSLSDLLTKQ